MLKTFLVNQGVGAIEVEEKYTRFVAELRTDKYVTVRFSVFVESIDTTWCELQFRYSIKHI